MRVNAEITLFLLTIFVIELLAAANDASSPPPSFSCGGRSAGYYADLDTGCQKYHMCDASGRRYTNSCPNQTLFQQRVMICDHWFMVDCSLSETHFGANLLIGQKDRHFVEHFQQESTHNQDRARSYPTRTREYYADPSTAFADDKPNRSRAETRLLSQSVNEIKLVHSDERPSFQSETKKLFEEKETLIKSPDTNRYNSQFSTSVTGSIKTTSERSLTGEFTNNPFFRSFTAGSSAATPSNADKGDRDLLTFLPPHQGRDQTKSSGQNVFVKVRDENTRDAPSTSGTSRTSAAPLSPGTFSSPPNREVTPIVRNTPTFPNYQERRTSTLVTTAVPLTYDYNSVTSQGRPNHPRTETPKLQKTSPSTVANFEDFTAEPSLTTQYEFLKTRERVRTHAQTATSHDLGVTSTPPVDRRFPLDTTQRADVVSSSRPPAETVSFNGVQRTSGGFRFKAADATIRGDTPLPSRDDGSPSAPQKETVGSDGVQRTPGGFKFKAADATRIFDAPAAPVPDWGFTSVGIPPRRVANSPDETNASKGRVFIAPNKAFDSTGSFRFGSPDSKQISGTSLPSGGDSAPARDSKYARADNKLDQPSSNDEDDIDFNTVEVRVVDPRRMFFIPDNADREAEMLRSNNETVLTIALPTTRHDGAMKFKGARGGGGRRIDCPQCHPAFLLPGKCHPCVQIRR